MPTVALQPWQMVRNDQKIPKIQMDKKYFTQRKKGYSNKNSPFFFAY
jgi:hypothetical protein